MLSWCRANNRMQKICDWFNLCRL